MKTFFLTGKTILISIAFLATLSTSAGAGNLSACNDHSANNWNCKGWCTKQYQYGDIEMYLQRKRGTDKWGVHKGLGGDDWKLKNVSLAAACSYIKDLCYADEHKLEKC